MEYPGKISVLAVLVASLAGCGSEQMPDYDPVSAIGGECAGVLQERPPVIRHAETKGTAIWRLEVERVTVGKHGESSEHGWDDTLAATMRIDFADLAYPPVIREADLAPDEIVELRARVYDPLDVVELRLICPASGSIVYTGDFRVY